MLSHRRRGSDEGELAQIASGHVLPGITVEDLEDLVLVDVDELARPGSLRDLPAGEHPDIGGLDRSALAQARRLRLVVHHVLMLVGQELRVCGEARGGRVATRTLVALDAL